MRAAGAILGGGGGGEVIYTDPTSDSALAALADGKWIHVRKSGQLPSAASTYADAIFLGTIPAGVTWSVDGRWSASFFSVAISPGAQVFRGTIGRAPEANVVGSGDLDVTGTSGSVSGQLISFRVDTNAIYLQTRITAAQAYTYSLDFWMHQLAIPV